MMPIVENILWLLVLIGIMILVHELGHFWAARYFDVRVETFSFGFGPRLFGFRRGETDFRFSAILFGGYVKMAGEQPGDQSAGDPRAFLAKPRWQRLVIAFAGPAMNILLAVVLLTGLFMFKYPRPVEARLSGVIGYVVPDSPAAKAGLREGDRILRIGEKNDPNWEDISILEVSHANRPLPVTVERDGKRFYTTVTPILLERSGLGYAGWAEVAEIQIGRLSPGMPAEKAGLRPGDVIVSVNGHPILSVEKLHEVIRASGGKPVEIEYRRNGRTATITVQPVLAELDGPRRWMIGVAPEPKVTFTRLAFSQALAESVRHNVKNAGLIYQFLHGIVERRLSPKSIEGPIGIARLSRHAAQQGPYSFIMLMAAVSLNLAILNLLPIPILDGGVILMLLIEMILRRDLSLQLKEAIFKLGFVFLLGLMVFVLYNDIAKILPAG